jgi:hypothetical protein
MEVSMPTSTTRTVVSKSLASLTSVLLMLFVFAVHPARASAQTTAFTYQGQLTEAGTGANGDYTLQCALFDIAAGGTQIGTMQTVPTVPVSSGLFTVQLDFGVVAVLGVVPTKVTDENGPPQIGDLLVTSSLPGRAMKAHPEVINGVMVYPTGAILGKALEPLAQGTGAIKVLVMLR